MADSVAEFLSHAEGEPWFALAERHAAAVLYCDGEPFVASVGVDGSVKLRDADAPSEKYLVARLIDPFF